MKSPEQNGGDELAPLIKMCSSCDEYFFLDSSNSHAVDYALESKKHFNHLYTTCPHCKHTKYIFTQDNPLEFVRNLSDRGIPVIEMVEPYKPVEDQYILDNKERASEKEKSLKHFYNLLAHSETAGRSNSDLSPEQEAVVKYFGKLLSYIETDADFHMAIKKVMDTPGDINLRQNNGILLATCDSCALHYEINNSNAELLIFTEIEHEELNGVRSKCPHCYANNYSMKKDYLDDARKEGVPAKIL
ncbi:MAG: hypothetical protein QG562_582 [Patescibacteria group bacterium]|nr:hypothetical protein [Patescibacteria group bacterium]